MESIFKALNSSVGVDTIIDFGEVYKSQQGHNLVIVNLSIEKYDVYFLIRLATSYSRGMSKKTRVIKWPYSKTSEKDLALVIQDIDKAHASKTNPELNLDDNRTGIGRWFDSLTGRKYYGCFEFASPSNLTKDLKVTAEIADSGKDTIVSLTETKKGHGFILAHPPHEAFESVLKVLEKYMAEPIEATSTQN